MPISKTSLHGDQDKLSERLIVVSKELEEGHVLSTRLRTARKDGRVWAVIKEILAKIGINLERANKATVAIKLHEFIEKNKQTLFVGTHGTQNREHFIKILEKVLNVNPLTQKTNEPDQKLQKLFDDCVAIIKPTNKINTKDKQADLTQKEKAAEKAQKAKEAKVLAEQKKAAAEKAQKDKEAKEAKELADKQKKEAAEKAQKEKAKAKNNKEAKKSKKDDQEIKTTSSNPEMKSALGKAAENMAAARKKFMETSKLAKKHNNPPSTSEGGK